MSQYRLFVAMLMLLLAVSVALAKPSGFTGVSDISITFPQKSYEWINANRTVTATVTVTGTVEPGTPGDVSVTGPGTIDPSSFTLPNGGQKPVSVTLPAAPGAYTYTATISRHETTSPHVHESKSATFTVYVVKVDSATVTGATLFNDGGTDPNTTAYKVAIAASGSVTVTFTPDYAVSESDLPPGWTVSGGTGSGKLSRTVTKTSSAITTVTCTCGSSTKTAKIYVYTASVTTMPSLCAGGKNDAAHKDTISVRAQAGGMGIPNASVELIFASPVSSLGTDLKPSFGTPTLTTDANGNANTTLTSGKAVLPSAAGLTYATANVKIKLDGYEVPSSDTALSISSPTMTVNAYYPGTDEPVTELYLYGDWCDIVGEASFTRNSTTYNVTTTHDLTWRFKFWASDDAPTDPENDDTYDFDGTVSADDPVFTWLTEYGYIDYDELVDGQRTAIYVTGTTPGWIWWYLDDADVLIEE